MKHNIIIKEVFAMVYERLRQLRESKNLKQKDIAKALNCSQQVYSNYELGQRDIPTDILISLAEFYKTNTDYILGLTQNSSYFKDI